MELVQHVVHLSTSQFSLVLIAPTHGGMAEFARVAGYTPKCFTHLQMTTVYILPVEYVT